MDSNELNDDVINLSTLDLPEDDPELLEVLGSLENGNPDDSQQQTVETQPGQEENAAPGQAVPYEQFEQVNSQLKALKAEMEALRTGQTQPVQQQLNYQQPQYNNNPLVPQQQQQSVTLDEHIANLAEEEVRKKYRIAGNIDELQYEDPGLYRKIIKDIAKTEMKIETEFRSYQQNYQENVNFVGELQREANFPVLYNFAMQEINEMLSQENDFMKIAFAESVAGAIQRLDMGQASQKDRKLIRKFADDCKAKLGQVNQPNQATTQPGLMANLFPPGGTTIQNQQTQIQPTLPTQPQVGISMSNNNKGSKLELASELPKSNQLHGSQTAGTMSWSEVERLVSTGQFDKIPPEILVMIDPKLLD